VEVFNGNSRILLERLSKHVNGPEFDLYPYIKLYTLDVICGKWSYRAWRVPVGCGVIILTLLTVSQYTFLL
jgi:hypothetical protein